MKRLRWLFLTAWLGFGIALAITNTNQALAYILGSFLTREIVDSR